MKQEIAFTKRLATRRKSLLLIALLLMLAAMACVRTANTPVGDTEGEDPAAEDNVAATKDAQVQMTLSALLGSATAEAGKVTATATQAPDTDVPEPTTDSAQQTALAEALTAQVGTATKKPKKTKTATPPPEPSGTAAPCYAHRYVYDETYPDGTRVDPGESIQKTWRLQNVGSCDWVGGGYELAFVEGDKMSGQSPLTLNYSVEAQGYANFSINLVAPSVPGTYRGHWILRTSGGELIGWGPNADQSFWVEITVRGATPTL